jgi:hypothetical protein
MFIPSVKLSPTLAARFVRALPKETKHSAKMRFSGRHIAPFRGYELLVDLAGLDALLQARATDRGERR